MNRAYRKEDFDLLVGHNYSLMSHHKLCYEGIMRKHFDSWCQLSKNIHTSFPTHTHNHPHTHTFNLNRGATWGAWKWCKYSRRYPPWIWDSLALCNGMATASSSHLPGSDSTEWLCAWLINIVEGYIFDHLPYCINHESFPTHMIKVSIATDCMAACRMYNKNCPLLTPATFNVVWRTNVCFSCLALKRPKREECVSNVSLQPW